MANTDIFEKAASVKEIIIDEINKKSATEVHLMKGHIIKGSYIIHLLWNENGECRTYRRKRKPQYDLDLTNL